MSVKKRKKISETNYWQSYSDMMAALLLIFLLVIASAFARLWVQQENLKTQEEELKAQETELEEQQAEMQEQQKQLEQQGTEYMRLNNQLMEAQEQLEKIIGIKAEIIESLDEELKKEDINISLDQKTGALRLEAEILFQTNESTLLPSGESYLSNFLPVYFGVLLSDRYQNYISEIIVEGNCDSRGTYEDNLVLSQERSQTVAMFCKRLMEQQLDSGQMEKLLQILSVSGRSNTNVIYNENNEENMDASRRVEIKFRLKDEEMMEEMGKILGGQS